MQTTRRQKNENYYASRETGVGKRKKNMFKMKNTVGWNANDMQEHVWECHEEVKRQRAEQTLLTVENNLWEWVHEVMGCFLQHSVTLDDPCKWAVLDVDHDVIAEGSTPLDAMKAAEKLYEDNLYKPST